MQDTNVKEKSTDVTTPTQPKKKKKFDKAKFLYNIKYDLQGMFIVKKWNIAVVLLLIPGFLLGLMMGSHIAAIYKVDSTVVSFYLFILILLGCISIFSGFSFAARRSLFHSVFTCIVSVLMVVFAILYIVPYAQYYNSGVNPEFAIRGDVLTSIICVIISAVCSVAGAIVTVLCIDHKIEKE